MTCFEKFLKKFSSHVQATLYNWNRNVLQWGMSFAEAYSRDEAQICCQVSTQPWPSVTVPSHFSLLFFTLFFCWAGWFWLSRPSWAETLKFFVGRFFFQISALWVHQPFNVLSPSRTVLFKIPIYPWLPGHMDTPTGSKYLRERVECPKVFLLSSKYWSSPGFTVPS